MRPEKPTCDHVCLHIGVGVGTAFSATYGTQHSCYDLRDIQPVTGYPGSQKSFMEKCERVPTLLAYQMGQKEPVAWGWDALWLCKKGSLTLASIFNLFLSEAEYTTDFQNHLRDRVLVDGRTKIDVIVDFLRLFRQFILNHIQIREEGEEEFATWEHLWIIAVPTDWSPEARHIMLRAAEIADYGKSVKLISELEAGAVYILAETNPKLSVGSMHLCISER